MCLSDDRMVFLDLRRDRYLCLNGRDTATATQLFLGSEPPEGDNAPNDADANDERTRLVIRSLSDNGLLALGGTNGKKAAAVHIQTPVNSLIADGRRSTPTIRPKHWVVFLYSTLRASWMLRLYSMQQTVRSVAKRRQRCLTSQAADYNALYEHVAIFHKLRPFYVRKYLCLYDSLALVEFLAHHRFFPHWTFGVTAKPFNAHCWVQDNDCVLNDTVEYVRGFTPIMVV